MKTNINTRLFWNDQNLKSEKLLLQSNIYKHKHKLILKWTNKAYTKLLNIGVGNGYLEKLIKFSKVSIELYGIDISDLSIKNIKDQVEGNFKVANVVKIPYEDNFFDIVTILDVLEHLNLNELNDGFKEIHRVLKPNGKLIISVPLNENHLDKKENRHLLSFSKKNMLSNLRKNNFKVNETIELFAFNNFYWIKTVLAKLLPIRKPNLLVINAVKDTK